MHSPGSISPQKIGWQVRLDLKTASVAFSLVYDLYHGLKTGGNYPSYCSEVRTGHIKHFNIVLPSLLDEAKKCSKKNIKHLKFVFTVQLAKKINLLICSGEDLGTTLNI